VLSFASASASRGEGSIGMVRVSWLDAAYGAPRLGETLGRINAADLAEERDELLSTTESVLVDTAARGAGDEVSDAARREAAQSIRVVDAARLDGFAISDPGGVAVVMPSIDVARARATAELLVDLAGMPAHVIIAEDTQRQGFIRTLNEVAARLDVRYVVYLAEDAFPGEQWLSRAFETMEATGKGLLAFNCGKWRGRIAAFGMVRMDWVRDLYGGPVFFPGYNARKADNELTILARIQGAFVYAPDCVLVEIDPRKGTTREPPSEDRKLFKRRFLDLFDGLADAAALTPLASEYGIDWRNLSPSKRFAEADFSTGTLASE
jgi:hypothetical protein